MNKQITNEGIDFLGLLTITFIILKLIGIITWSWFWILSPILIPIILGICLYVIIMLILIIAGR